MHKALTLYATAAKKGSHIARRQLSEIMKGKPELVDHLKLLKVDRTILFEPEDEPWIDRPILESSWTNVEGPLAVEILIAVENTLFLNVSSAQILGMVVKKIRSTDMMPYPKARLVELQVGGLAQERDSIISFILENKRGVLLDGTWAPFSFLNEDILDLSTVEKAKEYLTLICATGIPEIGMARVVSTFEDIEFFSSPPAAIKDAVLSVISPITVHRDLQPESSCYKFEFYMTAATALLHCFAKVHLDGTVEFERATEVIAEISVPVRIMQGSVRRRVTA